MARKLILSIILLVKTGSFAFSQAEEMKDVFNNMAFYNQKHDLKYLGEAKKAIDKIIITRSDSANLYKSVYRAVVYATIANQDSLNTLRMPDNFLTSLAVYTDTLSNKKKVFNYATELKYIKKNIANAYIRRGFNDLQRGNYTTAVSNFEKTKALTPEADNLGIYMAYAANKMGELNKSAAYYDSILQESRPQADVILTAEKNYKILGDTVKALKAIKTGRILYPENKLLLFEEANIYNNKKDYTALRGLLSSLNKAAPDDYDINFLIATCYDYFNEKDKAETFYQKAIRLSPSNYDPVFNIGLLYMKKGVQDQNLSSPNYILAQTYLEKANDLNPNYPKFLRTLKLLYDKVGNIEQSNKISTQLNQIIN